mgnify:FL=1
MQVLEISGVQPSWLEEVVGTYKDDVKAQELLQQLSVQPRSRNNFQLIQGVLRYKGCIWVGNDCGLHTKICQAFHDTPLGGIQDFLSPTKEFVHCLNGWV